MTAGGPGQLLFEFVRYWSHRAAGDSTIARQGRLVMFTEAVNSLVQRGRKATVNAVAHELGIDQSGASRLLSDAHSAGYVRTTRDPQDQRRRNITITQEGFTALGEARAWQEEVFATLTVNWPQERRDGFQQAMADILDQSHMLTEQICRSENDDGAPLLPQEHSARLI